MAAIFQTTFSECNFLNENVWISIKISLKFVPNVPINDIPAYVQIMTWRRIGDKPLSEQCCADSLKHMRHYWEMRFNGCHFDDTLKSVLLDDIVCVSITISLKFVAECPVDGNLRVRVTAIILLRQHMPLKSFPMEHNDPFILRNQYHDSWWPGDARCSLTTGVRPITTSLWRQNDVATSFWRHNDVTIASRVRWAGNITVSLPEGLIYHWKGRPSSLKSLDLACRHDYNVIFEGMLEPKNGYLEQG